MARTKEQQAAINADRAKARRAAAGNFEDVEAKVKAPVQPGLKKEINPEHLADEVRARLSDVAHEFGLADGTWKRKAFAFFASVAVATGAGYTITKLSAYAVTGILALSGSMLWVWLITILSLLITLYISMKIGQHVGSYVLSGRIDRDLAKAKDKMFSLFGGVRSKLIHA